MALRPATAAGIRPLAANWYAGADLQGSMYGLTPELHADARRFDASPAWLSHVGAGVALPWLASLDLEAVRAHAVGLANRLRAGLGLPPGDSPILSLDGFDGASRTLDEAGVSHAVRGGSIRLSCHLYSTEEDVAAALAVLTS